MSAIVNENAITLPVTLGSSFELGLRVKLTAGVLALAGATDSEVGLINTRVLTNEEAASVAPMKVGVVYLMRAAGAFDKYAAIYGAASGKVDDAANENFVGTALEASAGDNALVRVLALVDIDEIDNTGSIDGNVVIDEDFIGDYPAAATALAVGDLTKVETNGLGVISVDQADGVLKFSFDAVAEAATAALYYVNSPIDLTKNPIFECVLGIFDIGDDAALDINFGLASDTHATDFDAIAEFVAFHLDGTDLSLTCHSDDGTTDTAAVDTTVDLVDDTYYAFKIDASDLADVKFYYRALGATNWTQLATATTFDVSAATANWTPIVHVEKTSNDTTADVRLDRWRVQTNRALVA